MVWRHTRVYRSTFRKLPTGALFNAGATNAGPFIKASAATYQKYTSDGYSTLTTIADKTTAVKRLTLRAYYDDVS